MYRAVAIRLLGAIAISLASLSLFAQSLNGKVIDSDSNTPVAYANVYIPELNVGTSTDESGQFMFNDLPRQNLQIQVSAVGFEAKLLSWRGEASMEIFLSESHLDLQEVLVSVPSGKLGFENVSAVSSHSLADLEHSSPLTISEALSLIPGVNELTTGAGVGKPVLRGLTSNRVVTYTQGIRLENQQWGDEHGLGLGDVGIERVEVIKGPASLLYGSDAIGGVIYFLDDRFADLETAEGFINSRYNSGTAGWHADGGVKVSGSSWRINLFGSFDDHADYRLPKDERLLNGRFKKQLVKTSIGYQDRDWYSTLNYSYVKNQLGLAEDFETSNQVSREKLLPYQTTGTHLLSWQNKHYFGNSKIRWTVGLISDTRKEFEESIEEAGLHLQLNTFSYDLRWETDDLIGGQLIAGLQGMLQENTNKGEEVLIPDASISDFGLYSTYAKLFGKSTLQAGLRFDRRKLDTDRTTIEGGTDVLEALDRSFTNLTASAGLRTAFSEDWLFRLNLSSGFRAPNSFELMINGEHPGTNRYEIGRRDLTKEQSWQLDAGLEYQGEHFEFAFNPFYNRISDFITITPIDSTIDNLPVYRYNQEDAIFRGGELGLHWHPHPIDVLHVETGLSLLFASFDDGGHPALMPSHDLSTSVSYEFISKEPVEFTFFIRHKLAFTQSRVAPFEESTPSYQVWGAGIFGAFEVGSQEIDIEAGVKNLFDTEYIDHLSRYKILGIPAPGRSLYLGVKVPIG